MGFKLRNIRISTRIHLFYFILSFIPVLAIGVYNYYSSAMILRDKIGQFGLQSSHDALRSLNIRLDEIDDFMIDLAYGTRIQGALDSYLEESTSFYQPNLLLGKYLKEDLYTRELEILAARISLFLPGIHTEETVSYVDPYNLLGNYTCSDEEIEAIYKAHGRLVWTPCELTSGHSMMQLKGNRVRGFLISRTLSHLETGKKIGIISFFISADFLNNAMKTMNEEGYVMVSDSRGLLTFSSRKKEEGFNKQIIDSNLIIEGTHALKPQDISGESSLIFTSGPSVNYWYVLYVIPYKNLIGETRIVGRTTLIVALFFLLITAVTAFILSGSISVPLRHLTRSMGEVRDGNFENFITPEGNDEITLLTEDYNLMIQEIRRLIREVYQKELEEKEARFQALRAKINPHFLYNTLDTIRWSARRNQSELTSDYIERLSHLFRLVLEDSGSLWPLYKEVAYVKNYLFFQEIRFSGRVRFIWDISPDINEIPVPPLLIQPLAENIILHALPENGPVVTGEIRIYTEKDFLIIEVLDDGLGCLDSDLFKGESMALKNIRDRLDLGYNKASFSIKGSDGMGCHCTIRIPLVSGKSG